MPSEYKMPEISNIDLGETMILIPLSSASASISSVTFLPLAKIMQ